jgi:hypothetical protein
MMKDNGRQDVVISVDDNRFVLQQRCQHCNGGQMAVYSAVTHSLVGKCLECRDGLVDTPLFAAIKHHLGIFDPMPGEWRGKPQFLLPGIPRESGVQDPLHFYPNDWHDTGRYRRALCRRGGERESMRIVSGEQLEFHHQCQNCLRIKNAQERGEPVVYVAPNEHAS